MGLTSELASKVLAKVGQHTITLGDYAAALDRMNEFDRLRYQSPERRRDLLNEMIDLELLATEAERRGLDKLPETQETVRQILRDALLSEARKSLPGPGDIPIEEVRGYFDSHRADYREPERRRVSALVFNNRKEAEKVLPDALKANATAWGKLVQKYNDSQPQGAKGLMAGQPLEMLGDLGIVGPPDDPKGDNPRVPAPVRAAVFQMQGYIGAVLDRAVEVGGNQFYVIKIVGKSPAHERSFAEAERSIRTKLLQDKLGKQEQDLEETLKKQFPVVVNQDALANVHVPQQNDAGK